MKLVNDRELGGRQIGRDRTLFMGFLEINVREGLLERGALSGIWRFRMMCRLGLAAVSPFVLSLFVVGCALTAKQPSSSSAAAGDAVHNYVYYGRDRERISNEAFLGTARFEGAQLMYAWKELEPEENTYDFSEIQKDLEFLKSKGKKLFLQLQDATFDPSVAAVSKYLLRNPKYNGGAVYQYDDTGKPEGLVARRWDPVVRDQFAKLLDALGEAFDGKIEGINLQETSIGVSENGPTAPTGFTYAKYRDGIIANMRALKRAFPRSKTMQYANFMPGEWLPDDDHSYLRSIFQHGEKNGVGIGAPDLMPNKPNQRNHAYKLMHEMSHTVPIGIAVQDGNYSGTTGNDTQPPGPWPNLVPELSDFARNFLRADYIFWGAQEPYFSHDVVPYVRSIP